MIFSRSKSETAQISHALIQEEVERARLESALKNSRLVNEHLFPAKSFYRNAHVQLSGFNRARTEGSATWWFYYQRGSDLIFTVAQTPQQGLLGVLTLAASRAVFALLRQQDLSLQEIAQRWSQAIFESSSGKVSLNATIARVNVEFGEMKWLCANMSPPLRLSRADTPITVESLESCTGHPLGTNNQQWLESHYQMRSEDLILFPLMSDPAKAALLNYCRSSVRRRTSPPHLVQEISKQEFASDLLTLVAIDYQS